MDRVHVFTSVSKIPPPLAHILPTQKGWNLSSDIVNTQLFTAMQLYGINGLRPNNAYEVSHTMLANSAKYYSVVSSLLKTRDAPLVRAVDGAKAFSWTMRTEDKDHPSAPFTCHSSRAELSVALYNMAAAMMQWCALNAKRAHEDESILKLCIQLMGRAETILVALAQYANLATTTELSSPDSVHALLSDVSYLKMWSDLAFAQLAELFLVRHLHEQNNEKLLGLALTIAEAYDALHLHLHDDDEFYGVAKGFVARVVAIHRHYFRMHTALFYLNSHENGAPAALKVTAGDAAKNVLKSVQKKADIVAHIAKAITSEVQDLQKTFALPDTGLGQIEEANNGWSFITFNVRPLIPPNSVRSDTGYTSMPKSLSELFDFADSSAFVAWCAIEHETIIKIDPNTPLHQQWTGIIRAYLPESVTTAAPAHLIGNDEPKQPIQEDPRFPNRQNLYVRLRRLGAFFKGIHKVKQGMPSDDEQRRSQIEKILSLVYHQCLEYVRLIEAVFFDHTALADPEACAVDIKDITALASAVASNSNDPTDATIVNKTLEDDETQVFMETMIKAENTLRNEMQYLMGQIDPTMNR